MVSSVQVSQQSGEPIAVSKEGEAASKEEAAFLASLPRCTRTVRDQRTGQVTQQAGYLFDGSCVADPIAARRAKLLGTGVSVSNKMPLYASDGTIREGYLRVVIEAQANPSGQQKADSLGVTWQAEGTHQHEHKPVPTKFVTPGVNFIRQQLRQGGYTDEVVRNIRGDVGKEEFLRKTIAILGHNYATFELPRVLSEQSEGKRVRTHIPSDCLQLGLPSKYLDCCANAITRGGFGIESYQEALSKGDPRVVSCFQEVDAARQKKTLIIAAGVTGAVVLGAVLLKKGKKK